MNSSSNYSQVYSMEDLTLYAITGNLIISLPINGYIVWLILTGSRERMAPDFFPFNLAASDVLTSFCSCFTLLNDCISSSVMDTLLSLSWFALDLNRAAILCCVCGELYLAVVHPLVYMKYKSLRYRLAFAGLVWLTVFGLCVFRALANRYAVYNIYIVQSLLILLVTSFCSLAALRTLRKTGPGEGKRDMGTQKTRTFKAILIIMLSITLTYSIWLGITVGSYGHWNTVSQLSGFIISRILALVPPFLYLHKAKKLPCCKGF